MIVHDLRLFANPAAVARVGDGLLDCSLPKAEWTHEAHLGATTYLLVKHPEIDLDTALPAIIRAYNESVGGVNDDGQGYHDTITRAYLHGVRLFVSERETGPYLLIHHLINDLLRSPIGQRDWPLRFWSKERLTSVEARRGWVEPNLAALPQSRSINDLRLRPMPRHLRAANEERIMDLLNELTKTGGVDAMSRDLGIDQATAQGGLAALLPAVLGGMQNQAGASPQGIGGLGAILGSLGGGGLLANVLGQAPTDVSQGNNVLGQIFGNKDTSRAVAADAAQQSGISPDLLKKMLPIVAMLVAGYLAKRAGVGQQPDEQTDGQAPAAGGGIGDLLGGLLGGKGGSNPLTSILEGLTRR